MSFYNLHTRLLEMNPIPFPFNIPNYAPPFSYVRIRGLLWWGRCDVNVDLVAFPTLHPNEASNSVLEYPSKVLAVVLALVRYDDPVRVFCLSSKFFAPSPALPASRKLNLPGVGNSPRSWRVAVIARMENVGPYRRVDAGL